MSGQAGWVEILSNNKAEQLWEKLFRLVTRHSSIRSLFDSGRVGRDRLQDMYADVTQDLFLKLYQKNRWQHYLDAGYSNADVEHELYHLEIPNLVSLLLRKRHPEAYRMARRISTLVQSSPEFRRYPRQAGAGQAAGNGKLTLKVYGLREWPEDKARTPYQTMQDTIKDVPCRARDLRKAGRGGSSQIIISNSDLKELTVEIFRAIGSPVDIRVLRNLVISKLPIEDSRFVSIDAVLTPDGYSSPAPLKVDLTDVRPTPEQILLENESTQQLEVIAAEVLDKMREAVRNKPKRYSRLTRVAWHCYFDNSSPSQTSIAKQIGISNSLVSHYRKLFDTVIRDVELDAGQYTPFLHAFSTRLERSLIETPFVHDKIKQKQARSAAAQYSTAYAA